MDFSLNAIIIFYMYSGDLVWVLYAEYIMRNARLDEAQAGIKTPGEISIISDMQKTPRLWHKVKRNYKGS